MLGASFLPARFRSDHGHVASTNHGYFHRHVTSVLQTIAHKAFTHPIHTIVFVALLASTSYVGVLEESLFDPIPASNGSEATNLSALVEGARQLKVGDSTGWNWQVEQGGTDLVETVCSPSMSITNRCLTFPTASAASCCCHPGVPKVSLEYISQDCTAGGWSPSTKQYFGPGSALNIESIASYLSGLDPFVFDAI